MIKAILEKRGTDQWGSGEFGASRGDRNHNGIDYKADPGQLILSPASGKLTKIGYPYSDDLGYRYVQITTAGGHKHRIFYVDPVDMMVGGYVFSGVVIGHAQDLTARYPGITNHVHYEIIGPDGKYLNPEVFG